MEKQLRKNVADTPQNLLLAGAALAVTIPCMTVVITAVLLLAAGFIHPYLRFVLMCVLDGWILAARSLKTESHEGIPATEGEGFKRRSLCGIHDRRA